VTKVGGKAILARSRSNSSDDCRATCFRAAARRWRSVDCLSRWSQPASGRQL